MHTIDTLGIVLKRSYLGEADRLLVLYTRELGKVSAIAKGSRRPKSKVAGHIEPGNITRFELVSGKTFYIVTAARITEHFRFDQLPRMQALFTWLELIDRLTEPGEPNSKLFELVSRGLASLHQVLEPTNTLNLLELELYSTTGYQLEVKNCIIGREVLKESGKHSISLIGGGIVCDSHAKAAKDLQGISLQTVKCLRLVQAEEWDILTKVKLDKHIYKELGEIARGQRHHILERDLKSEQI